VGFAILFLRVAKCWIQTKIKCCTGLNKKIQHVSNPLSTYWKTYTKFSRVQQFQFFFNNSGNPTKICCSQPSKSGFAIGFRRVGTVFEGFVTTRYFGFSNILKPAQNLWKTHFQPIPKLLGHPLVRSSPITSENKHIFVLADWHAGFMLVSDTLCVCVCVCVWHMFHSDTLCVCVCVCGRASCTSTSRS